jgi:predicted component of type VI protein secretion system
LSEITGAIPNSERDLVLPVILGRGRRAGFLVQQSVVSRQHCELYEVDGKLMIRDLGSTNGTRVNQVRIEEPTELVTGDLLTLGTVTFRVECSDSDNVATLSGAHDVTRADLQADLNQRLRDPSTHAAPPSPRDDTLQRPAENSELQDAPTSAQQQSAEARSSGGQIAEQGNSAETLPACVGKPR